MCVGDIMSTVGVFSTVGYSNNKRFSPHSTEHPHGTHDIPHMHLDIPHGTQISSPTVLKITLMVLTISPMVLNTPTVLKISSTFIMISPHGTEKLHSTEHAPWYCTLIIQGEQDHVHILQKSWLKNVFIDIY